MVYTTEPMMLMLLPKIEADSTLGNVDIELHPTLSSEEKNSSTTSINKKSRSCHRLRQLFSTLVLFRVFFFNDELCVIARKQHPRIQQTLSLEQFYAEKHVTLKLRREEAYLADYFTEESIGERRVAAECDSLVSQMTMISSSNCLAAMVKKYCRSICRAVRSSSH
ncbi:hypothetical protein QW180_24145 [Vibrio sinaloensis]|nr:hypothetical protein [Vibrio sinaloensis]